MSITDEADLSVIMVARVMDALRTRAFALRPPPLPRVAPCASLALTSTPTSPCCLRHRGAVVLGTEEEAEQIARQQAAADAARQEVLAEAQKQVFKRTYNRDEVKALQGKDLKTYKKKFKKVRDACCPASGVRWSGCEAPFFHQGSNSLLAYGFTPATVEFGRHRVAEGDQEVADVVGINNIWRHHVRTPSHQSIRLQRRSCIRHLTRVVHAGAGKVTR